MSDMIPAEVIENKIYIIRSQKVMIDRDLALLYGVPTKSLNLAVKRNFDRFPDDFMFQLSFDETKNLRFQIETSSLISQNVRPTLGWGGRRHLPYAFTEQGVAMLSSVLRSKRAVQVNIQRGFTLLELIIAMGMIGLFATLWMGGRSGMMSFLMPLEKQAAMARVRATQIAAIQTGESKDILWGRKQIHIGPSGLPEPGSSGTFHIGEKSGIAHRLVFSSMGRIRLK